MKWLGVSNQTISIMFQVIKEIKDTRNMSSLEGKLRDLSIPA